MDETEETRRPTNLPGEIYDVRVMFRKRGEKRIGVSIQIRYSKKGRPVNGRLLFPEDINDRQLIWAGYHGEIVSVYHRKDKYRYVNMENVFVPSELGHKLESLVTEAFSKIANGNKRYTQVSKQ